MTACAVTIARGAPGALATKTYGPEGLLASYDLGYLVRAQEVEVSTLGELYDLLEALEGDERACVLRGAPLRPGEQVRRTYLARSEPGLARVDRAWVMLDLDASELPPEAIEEAEYQLGHDHDTGVWAPLYALATRRPWRWIDALLPRELRGYGAILQWSASAGVKAGISAHVWLLLDRAVDGRSLKAWLRELQVADLSPMTPVQPHYVARPRFEGGASDPHPVRLLMRDGERVVLPPEVVDGATHERMERARCERAREAVRARADAYAPRLRDLRGGYAAAALAAACRAITSAGAGGRHETIRNEAWSTWRFVATGELTAGAWRAALEEAAHAVLEEGRWREVARLLDGAAQAR